jgi:polysaccharide biosynthesis transport protein
MVMNRVIAILLRHWIFLASFNTVLFAIASVLIMRVPQVWIAKTQLILPVTSSGLTADLGTLGSLNSGGVVFSQQVNPLNIFSSILLSDQTLSQLWNSDPEKSQFSNISSYRQVFTVAPQSESTIISITVHGSTEEMAQGRARRLLNVFQQRMNLLRQNDAMQRSEFMRTELNQSLRNLRQAQTRLTEFQKSSGLVSSDNQIRETVAAVSQLTTTRSQVIAQFKSSQANVKELSKRMGLSSEQAIRSLSLAENRDFQFVRQKLSELEVPLLEAEAKFTRNHPVVQNLLNQRQQLSKQLTQYISDAAANTGGVNSSIGENYGELIQNLVLAEANTSALHNQEIQLQRQIDELNQKLQTFPPAQAKLLELQHQYKIAEGIYNGLVGKVQEAKLNSFSAFPSIQVLDQPSVEAQPSSNSQQKIAIGVILAALFGSAALVLFLESRNPLLSAEDLRMTEIPILGTVPHFKVLQNRAAVEAETNLEFQRLALTIKAMNLENRRFMVSSSTDGEGKTTVVLGLAIALATLGLRILIVDTDQDQSGLRATLGNSALKVSNSSDQPISVRPNIDLMTIYQAERPLVEFIVSREFEQSLQVLQENGNYDYILIDSASICSATETSLMASIISSVLFVVRPGVSERYLFQKALNQLNQQKIRPMGIILNGMEMQSVNSSYATKNSMITTS